MSHIFQRPLCEFGRAYDYAFRPLVGDPAPTDGGPCDDRPTAIELYAADSDPKSPRPSSRSFLLCPEHAQQLARYDAGLTAAGKAPRFKQRPG